MTRKQSKVSLILLSNFTHIHEIGRGENSENDSTVHWVIITQLYTHT